MSYEGYVERLCEKGHYSYFDAHSEDPEQTCEFCQKSFIFTHRVDLTNGVEYDDAGDPLPGTVGYPFKEVNFEDHWHKDHYGNDYSVKIPVYEIPQKRRKEDEGDI